MRARDKALTGHDQSVEEELAIVIEKVSMSNTKETDISRCCREKGLSRESLLK